MVDSCKSHLPQCQSIQRASRRRGKIALLMLVFLLLIAILAGFIGNAGHAVNQKLEVQHASDSVAFSTSMWMSRGMNAITTCNHLAGEATAVCIMHDALVGPEMPLGLRKNTQENRSLDTTLRALGKSAPISRIPSPYVPLNLTETDRRIIDFIVNRSSPSGNGEMRAFATLYDSRMTLKRKLRNWLAAKSLANIGFLVPPPWGYVSAAIAYGVHIAGTINVALIGKEWLLLAAVEAYASAAIPVQQTVIEQQLLPSLSEFAFEMAGLDPETGEFLEEPGLAVRSAADAVDEYSQAARVEVAVFPAVEDLRLPVQAGHRPSMAGRSGGWPPGWGTEAATASDEADDSNDKMERQLNRATRKMRRHLRAVLDDRYDLQATLDEIDEKLDSGELSDAVAAEYRTERAATARLLAAVEREAAEIEQKLVEIESERQAITESQVDAGDGRSQNLSLEHIPEAMDPEEESESQWVNSTAPYVDAMRAPILGVMQSQLPKSQAYEHYIKWTNRYTLIKAWQFRSGQRLSKQSQTTARWSKTEASRVLLVLNAAFDGEMNRKGNEPWGGEDAAARELAEDLFTVCTVAHRDHNSLFADIVYPNPSKHGVTATSQAIVYNANRQHQSQPNSQQAWLGWDTLNWDPDDRAPIAWGANAEIGSARWPWELLRELPAAPKVKLNWQAKLVPVTERRMQQASEEWSGAQQAAAELAAEFSELVHN